MKEKILIERIQKFIKKQLNFIEMEHQLVYRKLVNKKEMNYDGTEKVNYNDAIMLSVKLRDFIISLPDESLVFFMKNCIKDNKINFSIISACFNEMCQPYIDDLHILELTNKSFSELTEEEKQEILNSNFKTEMCCAISYVLENLKLSIFKGTYVSVIQNSNNHEPGCEYIR